MGRGVKRATHALWARIWVSQRWRWNGRWWQRPLRVGLWLLFLFTLYVTLASIVSVWRGEPSGPGLGTAVEHCGETGFACSVVSSIVFTFIPLAITFGLFLFRRLTRVRRRYVVEAHNRPTELVETAGSIVGTVVGRDDLCDVIQDDLRDRDRRRPHVIVGGVGVGKTAVLVELTRLLARRGAVPVPIRLRDATEEVDFLKLGQERFLRVAGKRLLSEAEGERVWRQLQKEDRIVVLADGLEEALVEGDIRVDRHHRVRLAVSEAGADRVPVVIASRPHDAINGLDAAVVHLEPLSTEAAHDYIEKARPGVEDGRLAWIIATAEVVETPLYLQITRALHSDGLLEPDEFEMRGVDRVELRRRLMEKWTGALIEGKLREKDRVPLDGRHREATVWHISGLACLALIEDNLQVTFDRYLDPEQAKIARAVEAKLVGLARGGSPLLTDVQVAASNGIRLGLVEHLQDGVRFPHSIMQAYLGSRLIGDALEDPAYLEKGLETASRELLVALAMYSRTPMAQQVYHGTGLGPSVAPGATWREALRDRLRVVASKGTSHGDAPELRPGKRLDIISTAIEIDAVTGMDVDTETPALGTLAAGLLEIWEQVETQDETTEDAKFGAVAALGESARRLGTRAKRAQRATADEAAARVSDELPPEPTDPPPPGKDMRVATRSAYRSLYKICEAENLYRVRLAAAQELGAGGDVSFEALEPDATNRDAGGELNPAPPSALADPSHATDRDWRRLLLTPHEDRRLALRGWLLPMLVDSVGSGQHRESIRARLDDWLERVGPEGNRMMPLSLEAALAQGFKHAANRRPVHPSQNAETRAYLFTRATEMLKNARFWYSRLTLLHALCLWKLSGSDDSAAEVPDFRREVEHWLRHRSGGEEHPFVWEAAELVVGALSTSQPERYIWIDESGVVTKVGSRSTRRFSHRRALWIPPSTGWIELDRRAQQLLADVLILLNLAERGAIAERGMSEDRSAAYHREHRLAQVNSNELPPCIREQRSERLRPSRTVGTGTTTEPGESCREGCPVDLCPYPERGRQPYRVELSEAFCRHQRAILRRRHRFGRPAPWQDASRSELMNFWTEMEQRARI